MSLIKNLVRETEKKETKSKNEKDTDEVEKPRPIIKSALDLQRLKLEKLMKNPVSAPTTSGQYLFNTLFNNTGQTSSNTRGTQGKGLYAKCSVICSECNGI